MCSPVKFKFHLNVKCLCLGFLFTIHRVSALIFTLWSTPLGTPVPRLLTANVCSASWQRLVQAQIRGSCNSYHEGLNWWPSSCQSQVWRYPSAEEEQVSPSVFSSSAGVLVSSFKKNFCPTEESSVVFLARWKTKNQYLALEAVSCVIGRAALTVCTASKATCHFFSGFGIKFRFLALSRTYRCEVISEVLDLICQEPVVKKSFFFAQILQIL